ncbi:unnamed protein product [Paramecium primaurelia]|uniref:PIPK domain-containing protein n=1 Tax=Paramecium primaurelia TaxID=5886 RepID=A0A8S1PLD2_PARPR|nr:unnamed protein product [Paramecium primaurelia]
MSQKFYTLIAFACVNVVCSSFIVFTYLAWKAGRKSPGDIVFALGLCQLSTSIYWMMSSPDVNTPSNPDNNLNDSSYCKWVDFTQNLGFLGQFIYNFAYCFTMRQEITNVLKTNAKFKLLLHSFCLVFTLCISLILFAFQPQIQQRASQTIMNKCVNTIILERNYLPLALYVFEFVYIISALYTIWYFYQNLPNDVTFRTNKKSSLIRYVMYIISTIFLSCFTLLSTFIQTSEHPSYQPANLDTVMMISTCSFYTLGSGILCYQRVKNPALLRKIVNMVHKAFYPQPKKEVEIVDVDTQFIEVQKFIRMFQIRSVLAGIIQYFNNIEEYLDNAQLEENVERSEFDVDRTSQLLIQARATQNYDITLNDNLIRETLSEEQLAIAKTLEKYKLNNQALNKEFNFYVKETQYTKGKNPMMFALAPKYFYYLFKFDNLDIDAHDSFSLEKNAELIENMINVDGGKSGEFFFFSYDNKWILKTITDRELNSFRQRMPEYFHHMSEYRKSLINKIYGIFSYDMNYISSSCGIIYHMVLMRNISQVPRPFVKRTFDMKGSEVAREALKGKPKDIDLSKITLKDVDFDNLEKWIKIDQSQSDFVKFQLIKDAEFFKNTYLLDYSLLIMKIDWGEYQGNVDRLVDIPQNAYPSQEEPNIYYHIAIIDYLQEWNLSKMAEKASKQLLAMNPNLNVSAQTPEIYAYRFINNLVNKIFR